MIIYLVSVIIHMKSFRLRPMAHISVVLNRFVERRTSMMPTLISFPSVSFVISTVIVLIVAYVYTITRNSQSF